MRALRFVALCVPGVALCCVAEPVVKPDEPAAAPGVASESPPAMSVASSAPGADTAVASAAEPSAPPKGAVLPRATTVLHVGDSFVHSGLTQRLKELFDAEGIRLIARAQHSTNSLDWAKRMPDEIASTRPDLVIVTLGGNEIASKHLDVQARAIRKIVATIGDRPCVWTTPPLWMAEDGLFDTLQANVAPCRFFETDREVGRFIPRRADKIHPTMEGGALWADSLVSFFKRELRGEPKPWSFAPTPDEEKVARGLRGPLAQ